MKGLGFTHHAHRGSQPDKFLSFPQGSTPEIINGDPFVVMHQSTPGIPYEPDNIGENNTPSRRGISRILVAPVSLSPAVEVQLLISKGNRL
ncbi:hypothetical protein SLE2022_156680 [Rubroshorea leprosula]